MLRRNACFIAALLLLPVCTPLFAHAASSRDSSAKKPKAAKPPRLHAVVLGGLRKVPYSKEGDPQGAQPGETELKVRPLLVDGRVKDWTTGDPHDVTERTFAVRRALRINDSLPTDKDEHWVWQRGPWMLIDRAAGHSTPLKLPDYNPSVSDVSWFRDYAAYCGLPVSGKHLYAVVSQIAVRKPLLVKKLADWDEAAPHAAAACTPALWQREPLQVTFQPTGSQPTAFDLTAASTALVEPGDAEDTPETSPGKSQ